MNLQHWFRKLLGEAAHPRSTASGKENGFRNVDVHCPRSVRSRFLAYRDGWQFSLTNKRSDFRHLFAFKLCPFLQLIVEPGVELLEHLGLRLGEGSGAVLALPVVVAAARVLREVATFDSAGVSGEKQ